MNSEYVDELKMELPLTCKAAAGLVVPMPTLPPVTSSVEPPTEKALPSTVTDETNVEDCRRRQPRQVRAVAEERRRGVFLCLPQQL